MSVTASASTVIRADPKAVLEFVLDLNRYKQIDRKFVRVGKVVGPDADGHGSVRLWGRIKGFPPAPDRQDFVLEPWSRLTFTGAARQPARLVFDFVGHFDCQPADNGTTRVTHSYEFTFKGPFRLIERTLTPWLQREIDKEVTNLNAAIHATDTPPPNQDQPTATNRT